MKRTVQILSLSLATLLWQCKDKYISTYVSPPTGYLVVEGFIAGKDTSQFTLTRTVPLSGNEVVPPETGARMQVEGDDNSIYPFSEGSAGIYKANTVALNPAAKYRIRINTGNGEVYLSDFVPFQPSPPIDSINWVKDASQLTIYANTHDPANASHYYQWNYDESWEYTSASTSVLQYVPLPKPSRLIPRADSNEIYFCWHANSSSAILLTSTTKLAQDVVYEFPLIHYPIGAQQLSVRYSVLVRQWTLTKDGYNYLTLMQKNTESLGSIFDAQPSILVGNIHCTSDPGRPVLGYISPGTVQQQRIFISNSQVNPWLFVYNCPNLDDTISPKPDSLDKYLNAGYIPIRYDLRSGFVIINYIGCIDCRQQGGTTTKPSFWPN